MTEIVGGWWVVVPLATRGGKKSGPPLSEELRYSAARDRCRELQGQHDGFLGMAYARDDDGEVRGPDGAIEPVLGTCPHGVDLDREFCPEGCRV